MSNSVMAANTRPKEITSINYKQKNYPPDIQKIIDRDRLVVGLYYKDKPPFIMTGKDGKLYGIDIDLARDIARKFGVGIQFNRDAKSYTELFEMAVNGDKVDIVISKFSTTFERAKRCRFSQPYVTFRQAILLNKVYATRHNIEDYPMDHLRRAKIKVGVREKTSYVEFAHELFKNAEIMEGKWKDVLDWVTHGKITAVIRDEYEIMRAIKQDPHIAVDVSVYVLKDRKDHIAVAVPSTSVNLLAWIDMYLDSRAEVMTARDIIRRYPEAWQKKAKGTGQ